MRYDTPILATLQGSYAAGEGVEVPEVVLPVLNVPFPLARSNIFPTPDLLQSYTSITALGGINQGASQAPVSFSMAILDRGVYRLTGNLITRYFVGPAPTSAGIMGSEVVLTSPGSIGGCVLTRCPINTAASEQTEFDILISLTAPGWTLVTRTLLSTGAGQSIGSESICYIARLF